VTSLHHSTTTTIFVDQRHSSLINVGMTVSPSSHLAKMTSLNMASGFGTQRVRFSFLWLRNDESINFISVLSSNSSGPYFIINDDPAHA
jgi:hypothetical protein